MCKSSIERSVPRVVTEVSTHGAYCSTMQTTTNVLVDSPETTAYVSGDKFVLLFAEEADITLILDQAANMGFTQLVRQWEDFTLARTGMEFAR